MRRPEMDQPHSTEVPRDSEISPLLATQNRPRCYESIPPASSDEKWKPPRGFWWIETALWANVFLSGFDGTITASTYALIGSEFGAANYAAWLTTSYLITSTAFQPLYGRFSDIFGRRVCFFASTVIFMLGCLGCGVAGSMITLNIMRAVTGLGGGGLITMATVINSDHVPFRQRGMYQAMQNILVGLGAILGASLGGLIAERLGWRYCFGLQVPVSIFALIVGYVVLDDPETTIFEFAPGKQRRESAWKLMDLSGANLLVLGLSAQVVGLSFGGNKYSWQSYPVVGSLVASVLLLALFVLVEEKTSAIPVVPLRMLRGWRSIALQLTNVFTGMASYAYLFMIPLYFQAVRGDSPSSCGLRLMVPALGTPIGGFIAGKMMSWGMPLSWNVRVGTGLMFLGNVLAITLGPEGRRWKDYVYLIPANFGLGLTNPSVLFSVVSLFEHRDQAVATSFVYLIRSMGTIYGITITSAIVQNVLADRLWDALGSAATPELVESIRKSVIAIRDLPVDLQGVVRAVYSDALRISFTASSAFAFLSFLLSWATQVGGLQRENDR